MKTILIATSKFGNPVSDYYQKLGEQFVKNNHKVVFIFDGLVKVLPTSFDNTQFYTWPSKRPTKLKDFIFCVKILRRHKPYVCISNFGSTNIVTIASFLLNIKNRINYRHTTSVQLSKDSNKRKWIERVLRYRKKCIYKLNTFILTNSNGTKTDTIKTYNVDKEKIIVLPLLIKQSHNIYKEHDKRNKQLTIVGRLHPSKGHKSLLRLFKECIVTFPNLKLNIIGDGFLKKDLIDMANHLKIESNVNFMGSLPNNKVGRVFSESIASISSSIDEAYGLVNIEALREGTPLICTKTAGSLDIINEHKNGLFIDVNHPYSLKNAIEKITNNWDFFSTNALTTFDNEYSFDNVTCHFKRILQIINIT